MAGPAGVLVHDSPGRVRLRVNERVGDRAWFERVVRALAACPGVRRVSGSPLTGSLLILHDGEFAAVARYAESESLFELVAAKRPQPFAHMENEVQRLDGTLRAATGQRWGVSGLAFYGLVGASLWQLVQGRVLPPSITLAFQALTVFKQAAEAERSARSRSPEG
jgi:hypothetical protein